MKKSQTLPTLTSPTRSKNCSGRATGGVTPRRRPFILLVALALFGAPAWSSGLTEKGLDDPQVTGDTPNHCLEQSILSAFLSFKCHTPNGYVEPESDDEPRQSVPEKPEPPKKPEPPEPEVCE